MVVLLAAVSAAAAALGYNLWGWLPVWGDEDVRFVAETPRETPNEDDMQNIPIMLASLGITEPLYPTWLPEDFKRTDIQIIEDPLFLHECFSGNNRELTITISPTNGSENTIYQRTDDPPGEHIAGNVVHYIFENSNNLLAVWYTENYSTVITGNIQNDEMKRIIDSVYGE